MKALKRSKPAMPESDVVYVDDVEAARRTSIARATFQKMRHEGSGPPYFKVGRSCLYRWSDVVEWIESHRVPAHGRS